MHKKNLDFCMSPHPLKMTLGKKCDLFHANMQYCIVIIVSNGKSYACSDDLHKNARIRYTHEFHDLRYIYI